MEDTARPGPTGRQFTIRRGDAEATVVEVGGGLRTYRVDGHDVLDGFGSDEMAPSGRGQVLVPWPNRLDHGRYVWDGEEYTAPINEHARSNAIHGLVRFAGWTGTTVDSDRVEIRHVLWPSDGYPFTIELVIEYELDDAGLSVTATARNVGDASAPYGFGQHPYLLPPAGVTVDECELMVPASTYLETDDRGLPVASHPVAGTPFDFTVGRPIGDLELDTAFGDLARDVDGRAHVHLMSETRSVTVWMDDAHRYVQIFTGDTVPEPRRRASVAIEPMTCPANAFATGTDIVRLEPGEAISSSWGIVVL